MRVLCIAAHPDDEVLGVGGTLLKHRDNGDLVWVVLTSRCRTESETESKEAERRMAAPYERLEYERLWESGRTVEDAVSDYLPDIVYTHSAADLHHDHQEALYQTLVACRPDSKVRALYAFETPSATDWSGREFTPQMYVDISDTIEAKMHAWNAYQSEHRRLPHPRDEDSLYHRALYWGQRAGVEYAEAFEVIREVW
jgi:LmbE family N-acetylglucosaminyl deacetylase